MIDHPYRVSYKNYYTNQTGAIILYARSHSEAVTIFYRTDEGHGGVKVISCELDVRQAEDDLAQFLAYRYRQTFGRGYTRRLRRTLGQCRIDVANVKEALAKIGVNLKV